jgi:hypothetical protein
MGISDVLEYFLERSYPRYNEYIGYKSTMNDLALNYKYPNQSNEIFLAIDWLSKKLFRLIDAEDLFSILIRILLEQSFIFICDDIQNLTVLV